MPVFRDATQLYRVFDELLGRLSERRDIAAPLLAGRFILRFRYSEPEAQVTVDLRGNALRWELGDSELSPDLELIQKGDVAHDFWLGRLNVPLAIASRKVVSRGDISKALALLPAIKPAFAVYKQVLIDIGMAELVEQASDGPDDIGTRFRRRARNLWPGALVDRIGRRLNRRSPATSPLPESLIPLVDVPPPATPSYRPSDLPQGEADLEVEMLRRMHVIRAFEEKLASLYADGRVPTEAIHLSIGQEACAVGVCFALRPDDYMATTHRGHGHMLAKGAPADQMMAEIMAKATGLCGGKGGSMHVTDASVGAIGANGIVGASPLIAAGAGHSIKRRATDQVAVAFFGDGATNQGMFHEALNFAAVLDLPVLFVVENNQYGEFTSLSRHTRAPSLADRAIAYGMPSATVDGNDVQAVYRATGEAVARARSGGGPTLLVLETYRWHGHMEGEPGGYRTDEEIASWKERCPIRFWRERLLASERLTTAEADELEAAAAAAVEAALAFALESAEPAERTVVEHVFAPEPRSLFQPQSGATTTTREISCAEAIREALAEEIERDELVYLLGEDVARGGYFAVTAGLIERFGSDRIVDTPISEYAIVGSAVGAAMTGCRPVAEILFSDFLTTCMDPIVNNAAKLRYMSGGQYQVPMVVRTPGGAGLGMAAQHSQSFEALLAGIPGLIVMAPATPADAKGLLKAAIRSNNPVLFFENKLGYAVTGPVPDGDVLVPIGVADIKRAGSDVTLVCVGGALITAQAAAEELARRDISVEIVDPRTLVPLDLATILASVRKTGRLVTLEEAPLSHGFGAEVVARICEHAFDALRAAPQRLAARDLPIPYNTHLERLVIPDVATVTRAVEALVSR